MSEDRVIFVSKAEMTRSRVIQVWFATLALLVAGAIALGASVTIGTGVLLVGLSLIPPAVVLMLWPAVQPQTIAEVLHDAERRG